MDHNIIIQIEIWAELNLLKTRACAMHARSHDYFTIRKIFHQLIIYIYRQSGCHKKILCWDWWRVDQTLKGPFKVLILIENIHLIQNDTVQQNLLTVKLGQYEKYLWNLHEQVLLYLCRLASSKKLSLIRKVKRPGVAIRTSVPSSRFSNWVLCLKPPVMTIDRNGTPNLDIARQLIRTCKKVAFTHEA